MRFYIGIMIPIVFLITLFVSINNFSGYDPQINYLSDMGDGPSAIFYNSGLVITGSLLAIFAYGMDKVKKIGKYILIISAFSLIGIGIFPISQHYMHILFSGLFFILSAISIIIIGFGFRNTSKNVFRFSLLFGLIPIEFIILMSLPIIEHFAVFGIGFWLIMMIYVQYKKNL